MTAVLVASSFTCQMGVFAAERGDVFGLRRWYVITLIMGTFFVLGQGYEYMNLVHEAPLSRAAPTVQPSTWPPAFTDYTLSAVSSPSSIC